MESFGIEWLNQAYRMIQEDKRETYTLLFNMVPLARTPQTEQGASAMKSLHQQVNKMIEALAPWKKRDLGLRGKVKSGSIVVIPDANDNLSDPLFEGEEILKHR